MTNFNTMNKTELRAYLIEHPEDKSAFKAFVDRYIAVLKSVKYTQLTINN